MKKLKVNRKIKDTVFTDLFKQKKYSLELYKALHPKDKDVTTKDITIITTKAILVNDIYNDLGLLIKDKIILLLESQSTWSLNICIRILLYLAYSYKTYFSKRKTNLYGSKKVSMPIPELYVVYTGNDKIKNKIISLNKEFFNNKSPIDLKVKVITESKNNDILYQYIEFSKITNKLVKKYGYKKSTAERIIKECISKQILDKYLEERKEEVVDIMGILFDQDTVTEFYENELKQDAKIELLIQQFKDKKISADDAATYLDVPVKKFLDMVK